MSFERVNSELALLAASGQIAELIQGANPPLVIYRRLPTAGGKYGLPEETDVIVPVPSGYPAAFIDLAGLPADSPLFPRLRGGNNPQGGPISIDGRVWRLASYHPHNGGGGPPWNQNKHGFHTYIDHLLAWLEKIG